MEVSPPVDGALQAERESMLDKKNTPSGLNKDVLEMFDTVWGKYDQLVKEHTSEPFF